MYYIIKSLIFISIYFFVYNYKNDTLIFDELYAQFFFSYLCIHSATIIYFRKNRNRLKYYDIIKSIFFSNMGSVVILSILASLTMFGLISRMFILIVSMSNVVLQLLYEIYINRSVFISLDEIDKSDSDAEIEYDKGLGLSIIINFTFSLIIFILFYFLILDKKVETIWYDQLLFYLILSWLVSNLITRKFSMVDNNPYYQISPSSKTFFLMISSVGLVTFFMRLIDIELSNIFIFLFIYTLVQILFDLAYFKYFLIKNIDSPENASFIQSKLFIDKYTLGLTDEVLSFLINVPIFKNKKLMSKLVDSINDKGLDTNDILYLDTRTPKNLFHRKDKTLSLFINLNSVNNYRTINKMLDVIRKKLKNGGVFVGSFTALDEEYKILRKKMPKFMFVMIRPIHFIIFRVFPKIPIINKIYFFISSGKRKYISKAEVFGRLKYFGFSITDHEMINNSTYFISELIKTKSIEKSPSYGPLIKLKRIGLNQKVIDIYKLRTMHPYSEFVQEDLVSNNDLDDRGKINDDYRQTSYGKVFRKLWIDEIPQLYNWIKGDVNLFGVRALSPHYFSLYPRHLQLLRTKFKPGLIPPYYADLPKNFDDILLSEEKYLKMRLKNKILTDTNYLFRALFNIVFKGARSS